MNCKSSQIPNKQTHPISIFISKQPHVPTVSSLMQKVKSSIAPHIMCTNTHSIHTHYTHFLKKEKNENQLRRRKLNAPDMTPTCESLLSSLYFLLRLSVEEETALNQH